MSIQSERTWLGHLTLLHNVKGPSLPDVFFFCLSVLFWHLFRFLRPHRLRFMLRTLSTTQKGTMDWAVSFNVSPPWINKKCLHQSSFYHWCFPSITGWNWSSWSKRSTRPTGKYVYPVVFEWKCQWHFAVNWVTHLSFNFNYPTVCTEW